MAGELLGEKCAVTAFVGHSNDVPAAHYVNEGLLALQHRGTDASGIAASDSGHMTSHRGKGMVKDVHTEASLMSLAGSTAIGHNRYATSGPSHEHIQPFVDMPVGLAYAHNGNLPDTRRLDRFLGSNGVKIDPYNDSEKMGLLISQHLRSGHGLPTAIELAYPLFRGAFSSVAMHDGLVAAFRDSRGIRPMALGQTDDGYAVASETCGLDAIGASYLREVEPGEMVVLSPDGYESIRVADGKPQLDIFEIVYFARPDSYLYDQRVKSMRYQTGVELAKQHPLGQENSERYLVVPVPDTSNPVAEGYAKQLGLESRQAIVKNRYAGRSFMQPSDKDRQSVLVRKHNIISEDVKGRDVIVIDDSIVRLNTLPRLVNLIRQAGARSVSALISSPPVRFPDYYGIDTPRQDKLAAATMTIEEIRHVVGSEYLGYLSLNGLIEAIGISIDKFSTSCFTGEYPIGIGARRDEVQQPVSMDGLWTPVAASSRHHLSV